MNWERQHIEVVTAAAQGHFTRASDLLREHLACIGCDPLAVRITARLREPMARDDSENLAGQLPGCHATPWARFPLMPLAFAFVMLIRKSES
jgi:hypothetical protein